MIRLFTWPQKKVKTGELPNGIYLPMPGELLVNKTNVTTRIDNIQQDTALIDTTKKLGYLAYQSNPLIFDKTFLNGYLGIGLTFNIDPFGNGNSHFFFQPTIGWTSNYPNWTSLDISLIVVNVIPIRSGTSIQSYESKSNTFYLIRAEFMQSLAKNSDIIIGTDIRGLFPKFSRLYAAYIGLNLNLDALTKVIADKK